MPSGVVPSFFLYGEPPRAVGDRFLHLEDLDDRTRPSDWNIRPHAHDNLNHVFHIVSGGGEMRAEDRAIPFAAPCLLLVPARTVHGFAYRTETTGAVLTISEAYLTELAQREAAFGGLFAAAAQVPLGDARPFAEGFARLGRELSWQAPGHAAAVEALLTTLLVEILRQSRTAAADARPAHGSRAELVARFRALVEEHYRAGWPVEAFAARLAVSPKRLRAACRQVTGASPLAVVQDRRMLEARRLLLYSNMTVSEAAYHLGFADPAYFSRAFAERCGRSPRAFRALHRNEGRSAQAA